jgi:hypothetical protein
MATSNDESDGVWRDEERLPLKDLVQAVAQSADDGQVDDLTGNDAGMQRPDEIPEPAEGDPDPDSEAGRALRVDFTGWHGPH